MKKYLNPKIELLNMFNEDILNSSPNKLSIYTGDGYEEGENFSDMFKSNS